MSDQPARGNALRFAFARELEYGIPGAEPLLSFRPVLPVDQLLVPAEEPGGAVNPSGFRERGIPAGIDGAWSFGHPLTAGHWLEVLENLLGGVTKETPEAGVHRYRFVGDDQAPATSLWSRMSTRPVERQHAYGVKVAKVEIPWGGNTEVQPRATGMVSHGTYLGRAVAEGTITGAYPYLPAVRGLLADPAAGDVVVTVAEPGPPLTFRVEQTAAAPTFPGPAVAVALDPLTQRAVWQNLQGADGRDLGVWGENRDPLEIVWPGTAADHALLAEGDTWRFPVSWQDPPPIYVPGRHQRFTSAHVLFEAREEGAPAWIPFRNLEGKLSIEWGLTPEGGDGSRYVTALDRDGELTATLELTQVFRSRLFVDWSRRHQRFEARLSWLGQQLGTGALRESITVELPSVAVLSAQRPASGSGRLQQTLQLQAETDLDGVSPVSVEVVGRRDWAPAA